MPHLELNTEGWERVSADCHLHRIDDLAEWLNLPADYVWLVITEQTHPDAEFVAACLGALPATFHDLFVVKIPAAA